MPRAARRAAALIAVVLALLAVTPSAGAVPEVQLATTLSIQATANGRVVEVHGRLVDVRDRPIANATLQVNLDATSLQVVLTNESGDWATSVTIPDSFAPGKHDIIVTYAGADAYKPTANSVAVNIDAPIATTAPDTQQPGLRPTTLTATVPAEPQLWGSLVNVTGELSGPNGERITGAPISVTGPSGIRSDCLTDGAGAYSCEIAVPDVTGPVALQAQFASMQGFAGSTAEATLQVLPPATPTAEESVASTEPTPSVSAAPSSASAQASAPAAASTTPVAVPPTETNYTPLLIALVGAFTVLGLGVLGLSLMRSSRRESVERFIDPDDQEGDGIGLLDEPVEEPMVGAAVPVGRYAAVGSAGQPIDKPRPRNPNAPRRALD